MTRDLKLAFQITLAVMAFHVALSVTGLVPEPLSAWLAMLDPDFNATTSAALLLYVIVIALASYPSRRELGWIAAGSAAGAPLALAAVSAPWSGLSLLAWIITASLGAGLASLVVLGRRLRDPSRDPAVTRSLLAACALVPVLGLAAVASLHLGRTLHPVTLDLYLYKFDASLGFQPSQVLAMVFREIPSLWKVAEVAYISLPFAMAGLYAVQLARRCTAPVSILLVQVVSGLAAWLLYQLFPATGPSYVFGGSFPYLLPDAATLPAGWVQVDAVQRNAMPSMHFGWAFLLWLNSLYLGKGWRAACAVLLGLTVLATLGLGEHYLIDLVVSVPCMFAFQALCMTAVPWSDPRRQRALAWGVGLTFAWLIMLRFAPGFWQVPGRSWIAIVVSLALAVRAYRPLHLAALQSRPAVGLVLEPLRLLPSSFPLGARIAALFVLSGFAGLVYQVLFSKALALTFGSMSSATYTVLATYMGGMAVGAWLGGAIGSRRANPLALYAFCELGIALYCFATPWLFPLIRDVYVVLAGGVPSDAPMLMGMRFALGMAVLVVPTVLMGMTLPVLARHFEQRREAFGLSVAWLYGANTLGAACGALVAGYVILPGLGLLGTTMIAVALNLLAAYFGFRLSKSPAAQPQAAAASMPFEARPEPGAGDRALSRLAYVILGVGGVVTLALEVKYIHLLAVVAGNSVYAFSLMLFAFLVGLSLGAEVARRLLRLSLQVAALLAVLELGLAFTVGAGIWFWDSLSQYFAGFAGYAMTPGFGGREAIRGLVCLVAMLPPAFFIGALYPVAMEAIGRGARGSKVAALGRAAAVNTAGNIVGVLLGGFILLPFLGALASLKLLAGVCLVLAVCAIAVARPPQLPRYAGAAFAVAGVLAILPRSFDYGALASGANVYFAPQGWGKVIDHAESVDGGLTTVSEQTDGKRRTLTLLTNGKFQGNDSLEGEMKAQVGFAAAPLLHVGARDRALVIGYGTGASARVLHAAGFAHMDVVELSADVVRLADRHFASVNAGVSASPGVRMHITDGRNYLMLGREKYDVVSMEISSIWFAGAASLYNHEFYELVGHRLAPHGVLQQWVQLHHLQTFDLLQIIGSVRSVFRYVWIYYIGSQGIIVASNDPRAEPSAANARRLTQTPALAPLLALYEGGAEALLKDGVLLDPTGVDRMLDGAGVPRRYLVSTDDNMRLEYSTPKGNVLDTTESLNQNVAYLRRFATATQAVDASAHVAPLRTQQR